MSASLDRLFLLPLLSLLLAVLSVGCGSNGKTTESTSAAPALKPIDQVQVDIAAVKQQLLATVGAAETGASDLPAKLTATESAIASLRETLAQLDKRSNEYLVMWSKQASVTVHSGGVYRSHTQVPQRTRAKYDEMLNALRAARDQVNPALADLREVAKSSDASKRSQLVPPARARVMLGVERLDEASKHLADLKVLVRQT